MRVHFAESHADAGGERLDQYDLEFSQDRECDYRAQVQPYPASYARLRGYRVHGSIQMSAPLLTFAVDRAFGPVAEGEAVVSDEGFSPRYDLDRWTGVITKPGHRLEGVNISDKILFFPTAKGGIAAGWAFYDIKTKGIAPKALVFRVTKPGMGQGAGVADMT